MADPILYGTAFSTYTRSARLALEEKGVAYLLDETDVFGDRKAKVAHLARHPFGKTPAFEHDGFMLYETAAIMRYVDEAFPGPNLQPVAPRERARMNQILSIIDSYAYRPMVGQIIIPRLRRARAGLPVDEADIESAVPAARRTLGTLDQLVGTNAYLAGDTLSLADFQLIPIYFYFAMTAEGPPLLDRATNLARWWASVSTRPSIEKTSPFRPGKT